MPTARPAQVEDRELLDELLETARTEIKDQRGGEIYLLTEMRYDFADFEAELDNPETQLMVGVYEDLVVGWGYAVKYRIPNGPEIGKVREIYVRPEARDIGVGEALLGALIDWAKAVGCDALEGTALPGNRETKGIFERFGIVTRMLTVHKKLNE